MPSNANGKLIINEYGNGFINTNNITVYIPKKHLNNAFHNEIVEIEYYSENNKYFGKVINYTLVDKCFIGKVHHFYKKNVFIYCSELKKSNLVCINTDINLLVNDWVEIKIISDSDNKLKGILIQVLDNDVNKLIEKKFRLTYIDDIINGQNEVEILSDRLDLRHHNTFTIDPINSKDCDDAFSIEKKDEKIHIYVHISDAAHYINPSLQNFNEIIKRGNTFYGKNKNWPMIPEKYSNDICSILPNKDTYVITHEFSYDITNNELVFIKWYYSIVESKNKFDYDYVDLYLGTNNDFKIIYDASLVIKNKLKDFSLTTETKSHLMVKNWMILVNQIMCKELNKIYRYNPIPPLNKFNLLQKYIKTTYNIDIDITNRDSIYSFLKNIGITNKLLYFLLKTLLQKAFYSNEIEGETHYGLGLNCYTHWTSPIRRSSDLICHLLLKGYNIDYINYLSIMNEQELVQDEIERFINMYDNSTNAIIGSVYKGYIIQISHTGITIYIEEFDDKFTLHISKLSNEKLDYDKDKDILYNDIITYKLFDGIIVVLNKIDIEGFDLILQ